MSDLQKARICDIIGEITENMNDKELEYALSVMEFWLNERKRQDKEIEELYDK